MTAINSLPTSHGLVLSNSTVSKAAADGAVGARVTADARAVLPAAGITWHAPARLATSARNTVLGGVANAVRQTGGRQQEAKAGPGRGAEELFDHIENSSIYGLLERIGNMENMAPDR